MGGSDVRHDWPELARCHTPDVSYGESTGSTDELRDAVARFIGARDDPDATERNKALADIRLQLEWLVRKDGVADKSLTASVDGLSVRRVVVGEENTLVEIVGAFYTLATRESGRSGELMLPMRARLSIESGGISTVSIAGRASLFEAPQSEREFQRAFERAIWAERFELRLV